MFNLIMNVKKRGIIDNITLEELIQQIKNPSLVHKKFVDRARAIGKYSPEYDNIKQLLPCFVPNYNHEDYVKTATIIKSTGFIYIDVDYELDLDFSQFSFIAASWKSLSGVGSGLLIALDDSVSIGTDLKTMRAIINDISNTLDIKPDGNAISRDRLNAIAYDYDAYYNENYTKYKVDSIVNNSDIKVDIKENKKLSNRLGKDVHFYDGDLRLSNIEDFTKDIVFADDELFKDLSETPLEYTEIYIPKTIQVGNRNQKIFQILSTVRGLNPNLSEERLIGFSKFINHTKCYEPIDSDELLGICSRVYKAKPTLFSNKIKKYPFNPIYTLTGVERRTIASTEARKKIGNRTRENVKEIMNNWYIVRDGKFTMKDLAIKAKVCYKTVLRIKKETNNLQE